MMTREELDELERDLDREGMLALHPRNVQALIAQARRAIELEEQAKVARDSARECVRSNYKRSRRRMTPSDEELMAVYAAPPTVREGWRALYNAGLTAARAEQEQNMRDTLQHLAKADTARMHAEQKLAALVEGIRYAVQQEWSYDDAIRYIEDLAKETTNDR